LRDRQGGVAPRDLPLGLLAHGRARADRSLHLRRRPPAGAERAALAPHRPDGPAQPVVSPPYPRPRRRPPRGAGRRPGRPPPGRRPSMRFASRPIPTILPVAFSIATTEGSLRTMPSPFT